MRKKVCFFLSSAVLKGWYSAFTFLLHALLQHLEAISNCFLLLNCETSVNQEVVDKSFKGDGIVRMVFNENKKWPFHQHWGFLKTYFICLWLSLHHSYVPTYDSTLTQSVCSQTHTERYRHTHILVHLLKPATWKLSWLLPFNQYSKFF
jgi:hypothetical protein